MIILAMFSLGAITFFYRYSFVSTQGKKVAAKIPVKFLQLLAPATFAAIIFNGLMASKANPEVFQERAVVSILSLFVAYWTESILTTMIFGLSLLYLINHVF